MGDIKIIFLLFSKTMMKKVQIVCKKYKKKYIISCSSLLLLVPSFPSIEIIADRMLSVGRHSISVTDLPLPISHSNGHFNHSETISAARKVSQQPRKAQFHISCIFGALQGTFRGVGAFKKVYFLTGTHLTPQCFRAVCM